MAQEQFTITSPAFENGTMIPKKFTCQGDDVNPPLMMTGIPAGTQTLALIVDDPDAPGGMWVHWVVYNIPSQEKINEDTVPGELGYNDFGRVRYGGPCPPSGTHRYFFKLYALDSVIPVKPRMTKAELLKAMEGRVLAQAEMIGLYRK